MNEKSHNTKVTQTLFDCVKLMANSGAKNAEIQKYFNISQWTVSTIRSSETLEEYKHTVAAKNAIKAKAKKPAKDAPVELPEIAPGCVKNTVILQPTHYMMAEMKKTNELLTAISNKLAFIVDELVGTKKEDKDGAGG